MLCNLMSYNATYNFVNDMNAFVSNISVSEHCLAQCIVPMAHYWVFSIYSGHCWGHGDYIAEHS